MVPPRAGGSGVCKERPCLPLIAQSERQEDQWVRAEGLRAVTNELGTPPSPLPAPPRTSPRFTLTCSVVDERRRTCGGGGSLYWGDMKVVGEVMKKWRGGAMKDVMLSNRYETIDEMVGGADDK
ncbi:hypothetical protein E2C01_052656 [Portunus trituberculatus]|uniref:Uncharacterized protein n=1 Tax=Portunus trituberculatus TaxID=210409 RepID=A0A5B7GEB0_PORTR|nr:hypothetical protein [Portunus trituberculatus]